MRFRVTPVTTAFLNAVRLSVRSQFLPSPTRAKLASVCDSCVFASTLSGVVAPSDLKDYLVPPQRLTTCASCGRFTDEKVT